MKWCVPAALGLLLLACGLDTSTQETVPDVPLGLEETTPSKTPVPTPTVQGDLQTDDPEPRAGSPLPRTPIRLTVSVTVYSCLGDSTGAYCPGDTTASGAPLAAGMAACGPSWPFGTVFRFVETGQTVVCADRGGLVHDAHLDVFCEKAWERDLCLPGIGAYAEVEIVGN